MTTAATSSAWKSRPPAYAVSTPPASSVMPVRCVAPTAQAPSAAVSAMPPRVPARAALVRIEKPWVV